MAFWSKLTKKMSKSGLAILKSQNLKMLLRARSSGLGMCWTMIFFTDNSPVQNPAPSMGSSRVCPTNQKKVGFAIVRERHSTGPSHIPLFYPCVPEHEKE